MDEREREELDPLMREVWYKYREPAYLRGEFRGIPNKTFRDAFFLGFESGRQASMDSETR